MSINLQHWYEACVYVTIAIHKWSFDQDNQFSNRDMFTSTSEQGINQWYHFKTLVPEAGTFGMDKLLSPTVLCIYALDP